MVSSRSSRKRSLREVESSSESRPNSPVHTTTVTKREPPLLQQIRNSWQFANLCQWIAIFGKAVKVNLDVDELETACLSPASPVLIDLGLSLLKFVSSHRGLNSEIFDEYTRRQYVAKAPERNPFGTGDVPAKFMEFGIFTKLSVLHQLTRWVVNNPTKLREKMGENKDQEHYSWRVEPFGWDREDRTYYLLDDNRLYRMTEPPPTAPPKRNTLKAKAARRRASKRRRISATAADSSGIAGLDPEDDTEPASKPVAGDDYDQLGGMKWECIAVTFSEAKQFLTTLKGRDENEKILREQIEEHLLPALEKQEESKKRVIAQRERELIALEKMAHAKRSSRIASKVEQKRNADRVREEDDKKKMQKETAVKEEADRLKLERERDKRLMSRERRLKDRESRRLQHEADLAQLSEDSRSQTGSARSSGRHLERQIQKTQNAIKELQEEEEEEDWIFDCVCGVYGHVDDGTHSIACERCNVWQHSKCVGISQKEAERDDFNFVCSPCRRREEHSEADSSRPRPVIKLKVKYPHSSSVTDTKPENGLAATDPAATLPSKAQPETAATVDNPLSSPLSISQGAASLKPFSSTPTLATRNGANGNHHPFSSPHPTLSPPQQAVSVSRAYSSIYGESSPISQSFPPHGKDIATQGKELAEQQSREGLSPLRGNGQLGSKHSFSTGSPEEKGLSPTKLSPPPPTTQANGSIRLRVSDNPVPSVLPPVAALSPSLPQAILTPPVKHQV